MEGTTFSNVQRELLKIFSHHVPEWQLLEIKKLLATYFAKAASDEVDKLWESNLVNEETIEKWAQEHLRKPE